MKNNETKNNYFLIGEDHTVGNRDNVKTIPFKIETM